MAKASFDPSSITNGTVQEDGVLLATGKLTVMDGDTGENSVKAVNRVIGEAGHGYFTVDANGLWAYELLNDDWRTQWLKGEDVDSDFITVTSADGSATQRITVSIRGMNDAPVIGSPSVELTTSAGKPLADIKIGATDVDNDVLSYRLDPNAAPKSGTVTFDQAKGTFTYTPQNGATGSDTFTIEVTDGKSAPVKQVVKIDLGSETNNGTPPVSSYVNTGTVQEDGQLVATGTLSTSQAGGKFVAVEQLGAHGHGTFKLMEDGRWTYSLMNDDWRTQWLKETDIDTDTLVVTAQDGSQHTLTVSIKGKNDAPTLQGTVDLSTQNGQALSGVSVGAKDVDNEALTYSIKANAGPQKGIVTFDQAKGTYTYTPASGASGSDSFTIQVTDGRAVSEQLVRVSLGAGAISGTNEPARITGTLQGAVQEDGPLATGGTVTVEDKDAGQNTLATLPNGGKGDQGYGTFKVENGSWSYLLDNGSDRVQALKQGQVVTDTITITSKDGSATQTLKVDITGRNDFQLPGRQEFTIPKDGTLANQSVGVLDAEGDWISCSTPTNPSKGTVTFSENNGKASFTYTANPGATGTDTFVISVADGSTFAEQTVVINIGTGSSTPVNTPATIGGVNTGVVQEDGIQKASGRLIITDPDAQQSKFVPVEQLGAHGHGTFKLMEDGSWTYTLLNDDWRTQWLKETDTDVDSLVVKSVDGTEHRLSVSIRGTNDAPTLQANVDLTTKDGLPLSDISVGARDVDNDALTYAVKNNAGPQKGTVTFDQAKGTYSYIPTKGATGGDSFTIQVSDGRAVIEQVVRVSLGSAPPNNPATNPARIIGDFTADLKEDGTVAVTRSVLVDDSDAGQGKLQALPNNGAGDKGYGTFSLDPEGRWSFKLDNASAKVQSLKAGEMVTDTITVTSFDGSASQVLTARIAGTNDVPVVDATPLRLTAANGSAVTALLATDVDGDKLTCTLKGPALKQGSVSFDDKGNLTYTPFKGAVGPETFTVEISDGRSAVTREVTVNNTNPAKIEGALNLAVREDSLPTATGTIYVVDPDLGEAKFAPLANEGVGKNGYGTFALTGTRSWSYTLDTANPAVQKLKEGEVVTDTITVTSLDGTAVQELTVKITGENDAPVVSSGPISLSSTGGAALSDVAIGARDIDGDALTYALKSGSAPRNGTVTIDQAKGTFTYKPTGDITATDSFTILVSDGMSFSEQTVNVALTAAPPPNKVASILGRFDAAVQEDGLQTATRTIIVVDPDAGQNTLAALPNGGKGDNGHGSFKLNEEGTWSYTLDNASPKVQALKAGETTSDTITVTSADGSASQQLTVTITGANDAPTTGAAMSLMTKAGTALKGNIAATDVDGDALSYVLKTGSAPQRGSVTIDKATGAFTYTPQSGVTGTDSFLVEVSDGRSTAVQEVRVNVTNPAAIRGTFVGAVTEDGNPTTRGIAVVTDLDPGEAALRPLENGGRSDGGYGTFALTKDGQWTYGLDNASAKVQALKAGETVIDTITLVSADGSASQQLQVVVTGQNDGPTVQPGRIELSSYVNSRVENVAIGAFDADGDKLTYSLKAGAGPQKGSVVFNQEAGTFDYIPRTGLVVGTDVFTIEVSDGMSVQTKEVRVTFGNPAKIIGGFSAEVMEDGTLSTTPVLIVQDPDPGHARFKPLANDGMSDKGFGKFKLNANSTWSYELDNKILAVQQLKAGETMEDHITVESLDGTARQELTVTIMGENDAPIVSAEPIELSSKAGAALSDIAIGGGDMDGDVLTYALKAGSEPKLGKVMLDQAKGTFTYTPNERARGTETFVIEVSDGITTSHQEVTIEVVPANAAAQISGKFSGRISEDAATPVTGGFISVTDLDEEESDFRELPNGGTGEMGYGTFQVDNIGLWSYTVDSSNAAVQRLKLGQTLRDRIEVTSIDGTAKQYLTITIDGVNDAPTVDTAPLALKATGYAPLKDVAIGATEIEGDTLSYGLKAGAGPTKGTITFDQAKGTFTYVPNQEAIGTDVFTIEVSDGTAKAYREVRVSLGNAAPKLALPSLTVITDEDMAKNGIVIGASDEDGDPLTYSVKGTDASKKGSVTFDQTKGTFNYTPNKDANGTDTFTLLVSDGKAVTEQTVNVLINAVNDAPTVNTSTQNISVGSTTLRGVNIGASDVDGDTLLYSIKAGSAPTKGSVVFDQAKGTFDYTPNKATTGNDTFTVSVSDGKATVEKTYTVTVNNGNTAPTLSKPLSIDLVTTEDTPIKNTQIGATDAEGDALTYTLKAGSNPKLGTVSIDSKTGIFTYTPGADKFGNDDFIVNVSDGKETVEQRINVTVNPTPDPTKLGGNYRGAVAEDGTLKASGKLTITDPDGPNEAKVQVINGEAGFGKYGWFAVQEDGSWEYTLDNTRANVQSLKQNEKVTDILYVKSADGSTTIPIVVDITGKDDAAVFSGDVTLNVNRQSRSEWIRGAVDPEGEDLTAALKVTPTQAAVIIKPDGTFYYQPNQYWGGNDSFVITWTDKGGNSRDQKVTVNLTGSGNYKDSVFEVYEGGLTSGNGYIDSPYTPLSKSESSVGTFQSGDRGTWTFTPNEASQGWDSGNNPADINYVLDGKKTPLGNGSSSSTSNVTLKFIGANDAPTGNYLQTYQLSTSKLTGVIGVSDIDTFGASPDSKSLVYKVGANGPKMGTVTFNQASGTFDYVAKDGVHGIDAFQIEVYDSVGYNTNGGDLTTKPFIQTVIVEIL